MSTLGTNSTVPASIPTPGQAYLDRGYGSNSAPRPASTDFASHPPNSLPSSIPSATQPQSYSKFNEEWDASQRGSSIVDSPMNRANSVMSSGDTLLPSRGGTLRKKASLRRSGSRRSSRAGSVRSLVAAQSVGEPDEAHSAFYSPVPTSGNPTEILINRFQAWRKVLKDLILYFKEIQSQYQNKSRSLLKTSNVINNTTMPPVFLSSGGIDEALQILRNYHKSSLAESKKSEDIENDVILALVGLRSDLNQKIKEIKNLSGDFKNSVDKEMENTRKAVHALQDSLGQAEIDPAQLTGKQDPYLLRLAVDRQVERQIDEENYLHQAYLNLEASGRELEAIVVGEIQKSYNAYAGILKREADGAYAAVEELRTGPIAMPKDHEWAAFVENDEHFVDPRIPIRQAQNIRYPGRDNELASCIREGLLERKSKFLRSYTAGWYTLSPTHLHEFRSADKNGAPVMSLYLPEQKLGSKSAETGSSNKFILKGRQTGAMHRGHTWIFRSESRDTMLAWFEDIKNLTEKSPQERNAFVRQHARSVSGTSQKASSISSDGMVDEEDEEPFSAAGVETQPKQDVLSKRPNPSLRGRFPSDIDTNASRSLQAPLSPSSGSSAGFGDFSAQDHGPVIGERYGVDATSPTHAAIINQYAKEDGVNPYTYEPIQNNDKTDAGFAAAGLPTTGVVGTEAYRKGKEAEAANTPVNFAQRQQDRAAYEAATIAAPDTYEQQSEQLAAREAATIASPDTTFLSHENLMSGGRSQGNTPTPNPAGAVLRPLTTDTARPSLAAVESHTSVQTISHLHVPGEYPKNNVEAKTALGA